jgi:transcriptional regulator with XRE-family HTH domain
MAFMIGGRIRESRQSQGRSLADVAGEAKISVATLSRIENEKQTLDLGLFLELAKILDIPAAELLGPEGAGHDGNGVDPLARRISAMQTRERTELWRELAAERRNGRGNGRGKAPRELGQQVEELVAQIDFLRGELELVRKRVKAR